MNARAFLNATAVVVAATMLGRLLGFVREIMIAGYFGTGPVMDAFIVAFRIPDVLYNGLTSSLIATPFIPVFAGLLGSASSEHCWRFFSSIFNICITACIFFALLLFAGAGLIVRVIAPGLDDAGHDLAVQLSRIMIPVLIFGGLAGLFRSVLNTFSYFGVPALAPVAYNCAIIGSLLTLAGQAGIEALAYGILFAAVAQALMMVPALRTSGARYVPAFSLRDPEVRAVGRLFWPVFATLLIGQAGGLAELFIASGTGDGAISYLNYAMRLFNLPQQLYLLVVSMVLFPLISQRVAATGWVGVSRLVPHAITITTVVMLPAAILLFGLAKDVVTLVLQRGAFDEQSSAGTTAAFAAYACSLPYYCLSNLIPFFFFAMRKNTTMLVVTTVFWVINIVLDLLLVSVMSYPGIAWAGTITAFVLALMLAIMLERLPQHADSRTAPLRCWQPIAASAVVLVAALAACTMVSDPAQTVAARVFSVALIAAGATVLYAGYLWWSGDAGLAAMLARLERELRLLPGRAS